MNTDLISEIVDELDTELRAIDPDDPNLSVLPTKVKAAYRRVQVARNYPKSWAAEQISADMVNYYQNIRDLALYEYNTIGAEYQSHHEENGTIRTWYERDKCLRGVFPFVSI